MVRNTWTALAATLFAIVLLVRLWDGSAAFLLQSWYLPILALSAVLLLGISAAALVSSARKKEREPFRPTVSSVLAAALIGMPIVVGVAVKPEPLGSSSLDTDAGPRDFAAPSFEQDASLRNIYQWAYEFATVPPSSLVGQSVEVVGFVFHKEGEQKDQFNVARFVVACCVADAQGFALPVVWKDAAALPSDGWVRVKGRVALGSDGAPLIEGNDIQPVEAPSNPYIYP